jgi:hypothetical protein
MLLMEAQGGVLPNLKLLDPACGSGAFLVAAMKTLIAVYSAVIGQAETMDDPTLRDWLADMKRDHPSVDYFIKRRIITDNLFGVDIMDEAVEIARLRLFLALVASVENAGQLEPLPNIDFNILPGNSLIGLLRVDEATFNQQTARAADSNAGQQLGLSLNAGGKSFAQVVAEKNRLIQSYRSNAQYGEHLQGLRDQIEARRREDAGVLNELLLNQFQALGIQVQQATWDEKRGEEGKPVRRELKLKDIEPLAPFHWGYDFDEVMNARGGFDAIITNPPWEVFQTDEKEFFLQFDEEIQKKNIRIEDWNKQFKQFMRDASLRKAWLQYVSSFPHVSGYYRKKFHFDGKINLNLLFLEQSFNLLRSGGLCGIIIPSGIYTDLGAKQLRLMMFDATEVSSLLGLSNERFLFENVHHAFKFALLTFRKGSATNALHAAFRINTREAIGAEELDAFLHSTDDKIVIPVDLVRRLSPDSLSVMEFKSDIDVQIAEKMLRFPLLGEQIAGVWNLKLKQGDFNMTTDSYLFKTALAKGRLPLYEGKMIHQFDAHFAEPRYWVEEREGRKALLGNQLDRGELLDYQRYRLGFRDIAASTNERSAIATILPKSNFVGNTLPLHVPQTDAPLNDVELLALLGVFNSFVFDSLIKKKITSHLNMFYVYQMPVPRLGSHSSFSSLLVTRAGALICTTPEFNDLRKAVEKDLGVAITPATGEAERARLRAELDGMVAHLYGLSEAEFAHVLSTFPLVAPAVKAAALAEYRALCDDAAFQQAVAEAVASQDALRARKTAAPPTPAIERAEPETPLEMAAPKPARIALKPKAVVAEAEPLFRPSHDDFDKDDLLAAVRDAFDAGSPLARDEVIRNAARVLGFERAGSRIAEALDNAIATAVRRGFIENAGDALRLFCGGLADWYRDAAKEQFLAAIGRGWIEREEAIKRFSRWLGYRRAGPAFDEACRSLINGLIREGRLEAIGNEIRRLIQ